MRFNSAGQPCGIVTNIQKYTIHDGPGIRTEIFFKGCPMHCLWCSNPECISPAQELGVYPKKCVGAENCGYCLAACPLGGDSPIKFIDGELQPVKPDSRCQGCFRCAEACPSGALKLWGKEMTVPELMKIILEDRSFYLKTGGGVTLNGGEVMVQWEFAEQLLTACRSAHISTCVESALLCPTEHLERILPLTDILITDIKHMDSALHRRYTGADNTLILQNIARAAELGTRLVVRTPVVPEHNDSPDCIRAICAFLRDKVGAALVQYQLLPYRKMGTEKYDTLGQPYPMGEDYKPPEREQWEPALLELTRITAEEFSLPAAAGSSGKLPL